jgi:hypothetical protein
MQGFWDDGHTSCICQSKANLQYVKLSIVPKMGGFPLR